MATNKIIFNTVCLIGICLLKSSIFAQTTPIKIDIDANEELVPMNPIWAWWGYDEPNYTYMKDGKKLLSEIAELSPIPVYVRTHSLLVTGEGYTDCYKAYDQ